ncbi:glutamate ABC transporter substrate-binding protein [Kutzneria kofuensis]|uniref:Glutamate transport system substrate-binding protein n=1 Tax=Kutzneria kofuensis TaxID=103725 RepID=A0A7W9KLI2_9PSEU|nr:glutamate ABC transporter substrate-binding protein [Kutzneria kofuensis]MBB5894672.1 glutamate transport system substrate-binding protein [Kutzneria kofuensis]
MRLSPVLRAGALVATLALAVTACGGKSQQAAGGSDSLVDRAKADNKLTVGIKFDQPGLGLKTADGYTGFDVDVAKYIAKKLGVDEKNIVFKQAPSAQREDLIAQGDVDLVIATYTINDKRKQKVSFAGPYFVAGQDLLVKADDTAITGPDSLNGKKLCSVTGSTSAQNIQTKFANQVALQQYGGYSECVTGLLNGAIDAISTDDIILQGYAAANQGKLKVVGKPFSNEPYGIGLKKGDTKTQQALDGYIQDMEKDGSWAAALKKNFGDSYKVPAEPPITEK